MNRTLLFFVLLLAGFAHANSFTDKHLRVLLAQSEIKQSSGLIYIWSPRMNLSILGAHEIQVVAHKLNLEVTFVLDPAAVSEEVKEVVTQYPLLQQTPKLESETLIGMNMKIHFPSLIIYQNGKLLSISRPGYDEPERVEEYLTRRLQ